MRSSLPSIQCDATLSRKPRVIKNIGGSVKARLKNKAVAQRQDLSLVLTRYALERFLYRLSVSEHANHFLLKGALLFDLWFDVPLRATRDIDLLGFGLLDTAQLIQSINEICVIECADGIQFDVHSIRSEEIRKEANYSGIRISLESYIESARCVVQVDIGYGDAVTPAPELADYPVMLPEFPAPKLRVYPRYTVVAEKLDAIISLGMANSRLKDYFDLWVLLQHSDLDSTVLRDAVLATVKRRSTRMPLRLPIGLTEEFSNDVRKNIQWQTFVNKNQIPPVALSTVVEEIRNHLHFLFPGDSSVNQASMADLK